METKETMGLRGWECIAAQSEWMMDSIGFCSRLGVCFYCDKER